MWINDNLGRDAGDAALLELMRRVEKAERLDDCIEEIRRRFGKRAVFQACLLGDLKMPIDNRHLVQMPGVMGR